MIESRFKAVDEALAKLRAELETEQAKALAIQAAVGGGGLKPIKPYRCFNVYVGRSDQSSPSSMTSLLDSIIRDDTAIRAENEANHAHNLAVVNAALDFCKMIGLPTSQWEMVGTGRRAKKEHVTASWQGAIRQCLPAARAWSEVERCVADQRRAIESWAAEVEQKKRVEAAARATKEAEQKRDRLAGAFAARYGLAVDADASDVLDAVLARNKYLRLAHYLRKNRGDWSEGASYARAGLRGFTAETPEDREIEADIAGHIDSWEDGDGRIFRDCEWNYDRLFEMAAKVAPDVFADYKALIDAGAGE